MFNVTSKISIVLAAVVFSACGMNTEATALKGRDVPAKPISEKKNPDFAPGAILTLKPTEDVQAGLVAFDAVIKSDLQQKLKRTGFLFTDGEPLKGYLYGYHGDVVALRKLDIVESAEEAFVPNIGEGTPFELPAPNQKEFEGIEFARAVKIQLTPKALKQYAKALVAYDRALNTSIIRQLRGEGYSVSGGMTEIGIMFGYLRFAPDMARAQETMARLRQLPFVEGVEFNEDTIIGGGVTGSN